jgi:hypothetical protein
MTSVQTLIKMASTPLTTLKSLDIKSLRISAHRVPKAVASPTGPTFAMEFDPENEMPPKLLVCSSCIGCNKPVDHTFKRCGVCQNVHFCSNSKCRAHDCSNMKFVYDQASMYIHQLWREANKY